ncbi:oogenesis-related protein sosie isoform X3 [Lycorma delicatula]|uniref:oogenesis-related protein sosie isoform X3 n=1 Tax=Lycorma delicatula TaxID=130591 RepID=UPI003F514011
MWNWCWGVVLASAVLGASAQENQIRAKRLTTFGKTAPVPSQPPSTDTRGYVPLGIRRPNKALRSPCSQDSECIEGAECVINPNATVNINQKMCYCMPGWIEVDQLCSGSQSLSKSTATSIFIVSFIILLTFPSM